MQQNEILEEIYHVRADMAREAGYDVDKMFARMREGLARSKAQGWKIVSLPPRPAEKSGAVSEDPPAN